MIDKISTSDCCLCKACSNICPRDAIAFTKEDKYFSYPVIDFEKCIKCNLCEKVCPAAKELKRTDFNVKSFAARSTSKGSRLKSSSGGVFYETAKSVIDNGGYVCGTIFTEDFHVVHHITNKQEILEKMRGSKYAQSNTEGIYRDIKKLLDSGNKVLFCGCPCQVAGLNSYLQKSYDNLILIDLVCHGIPSDCVLQEYINCQEVKYKSKVNEFTFRDKTNGWHNSTVKIRFKNDKVYKSPMVFDPYMKGYFGRTTMKESCYTCKYNNFRSGSDLTIGDFWGSEVTLPNIDDNTGLSAVLVNSQKGLDILKISNLDLYNVSLDTIIKHNKNIIEPSEKNKERDNFYKYAEEKGIANALDSFYRESKKARIKRKTKNILRIIYYAVTGKGKPLY